MTSNTDITLCKRYLDVHKNSKEQQADFDALTKSIEDKYVTEWEDEVKAWEKDLTREDPYISAEDGAYREDMLTRNLTSGQVPQKLRSGEN